MFGSITSSKFKVIWLFGLSGLFGLFGFFSLFGPSEIAKASHRINLSSLFGYLVIVSLVIKSLSYWVNQFR